MRNAAAGLPCPPCTRHILSLYEERMQRRSGTTLSIGFSLHPFLNDRFAEQTNLLIVIVYNLQRTDCLSVCVVITTMRAMQTFGVQNIKLVALLSCKTYLFCCARYFLWFHAVRYTNHRSAEHSLLIFHTVRCAYLWSAGAKPLQVPPPSLGKGVGGWGYKDLDYCLLNYSKFTSKSKSLHCSNDAQYLISLSHPVQSLTEGQTVNNAVSLTNAGAPAALHPAYTFFTQRKYTKKRRDNPFDWVFPAPFPERPLR